MFPYYTLVNKKTAKCSNSLLGLTVCLHFSGLRWNLIRQQSLHFVLDNFVFKTFFFFLKVLGWTNPIFCVGSWVRAKPARATERKTMFGRALLVFFPLSSPCYVSACLFFCLCFVCRSSYRKWRTSSCAGLSAGRGEVRSAPKGSFVRGKMF